MPDLPGSFSRFTSLGSADSEEVEYFGAVSRTGLLGRDQAPSRLAGEISDSEPDNDYDDVG
jgi:hypothetical protein